MMARVDISFSTVKESLGRREGVRILLLVFLLIAGLYQNVSGTAKGQQRRIIDILTL